MPFELKTIDTPLYLRKVLPVFQGEGTYSNSELVDITARLALSESPRRTRHLTTHWYLLGLLDRTKRGLTFRYSLSSFGEFVLQNLEFSPPLTIELIHWAWYSGALRSPEAEWGASWLYKTLSDTIWESSPTKIRTNKLLADMVELANRVFPDEYPSFNVTSVTSVVAWLSELDPPFLIKQNPKEHQSSYESCKRQSCSPELVHLAVQLQYTVNKLAFGTHLLMDDALINAISKVCLLDPRQFWPMVDLCILTYPTLTRKETAYGTSLSIVEPAGFTSPVPRPLRSTSR